MLSVAMSVVITFAVLALVLVAACTLVPLTVALRFKFIPKLFFIYLY